MRNQHELARGWQTSPVDVWATLGALCLCFIAYVWGRWMLSPGFVPTPPGPDPMPEYVRIAVATVQYVGPIGWLLMAWQWLYKPWRRTGNVSVEGLVMVGWSLVYFQDPLMSYTANHLAYNAYLTNYGAWTTGIFPGWIAPNTNRLAEPIIVGLTAYAYAGFLPALFVSSLLRRARARWPNLNLWPALFCALVLLMLIDTLLEGSLVQLEIEAYPASIRAWSLFPDSGHPFPLSEAFLWGLNMMTSTLLFAFRADNGQTLVERGSERYKSNGLKYNVIRALAVIAFVQAGMFVTWVIPQQWFGTHGDPWVELPSYLSNGICGKGSDYPCPRSGIPIPRAP